MREKWPTIPLGECCDIISGATPRRNVPENWGNDIPWVTPKDLSTLDQTILEDAPEYISQKGFDSCSTSMLPKGSILFSSRAPIGLVAITGRGMCTNQGFKSLVPSEKVNSEYLYHCMKWMAPRIANLGNGATFKEVSKTVVSAVKIPLPPLAEQKHIAAILDKANAIRRKRQAAIKLADDFLRATFLHMFGDPVTNPKEWKRVPLKEVLERIDSGWSPKCNKKEPGDGEWGVLKLSAVTSCNFLEHECKTLPPDLSPKPSLEVHKGDLLFTRKNTHDLVAACALIHSTRSNLLLSDLIFRLVIKDDAQVVPAYLWALLTHPSKRKQIQGIAGGAAGSMPNISKGRLLEQKIEVPDINLQKKFSLFLSKFIRLKDKLLESAINTDLILESLTQRAFRGEL